MNRKATIEKAAQEVKQLKGGLTNTYGVIPSIVKKYQAIGYDYVTRGTISHYLDQEKKCPRPKQKPVHSCNDDVPRVIELGTIDGSSTASTVTRSLTFDDSINQTTTVSSRCVGGRPKGTTNQAKLEHSIKLSSAITKAAVHFADERSKAKSKGTIVRSGMLKSITTSVEEEFGLLPGELKLKTIKGRVDRNNLTGVALQRVSPIAAVEPIIVDYCVRLANMGVPLCRAQVISLADSIISGTKHQADLANFKERRHLLGSSFTGPAWYNGFMKRHSDLIVSKHGWVKDIKRHSWCVYDTFEAMYREVYEQMVISKVAIKLDEPVLYNKEGCEVLPDDASGFGHASKYKVTDPRYIIFVDETGKNTNMKNDGKAGGRKLVIPADAVGNNCGYIGSTTDIHFTVLCFTCATGEPVMCAVIFKSEKNISELPVTWKYRINIRKDVLTGKHESKNFFDNYGESKATTG